MKMIEKIVREIEVQGLRQAAVERASLLSENRISKWKAGTGEPTARELWRLARVLNRPLLYFIEDDAEAPQALNDAAKVAADMAMALGLTKDQVIRGLNAVALQPQAGPLAGLTSYSAPIPSQEEARAFLERRKKK